MTFSTETIMIINIVLIVLFIFTLIQSYRNGLVSTLIDFLASMILFIVAIPLSDILSKYFNVFEIKFQIEQASFLSSLIQQNINRIIWFLVIVVVGSFLLKLLSKVTKGLNEVMIVGTINKVLGLIVGLILTIFYAIVFSAVLQSPFIKNGKTVIQNTVLSIYQPVITVTQQYTGKWISEGDQLLAKIMKKEEKLSDKEISALVQILKEKGVSDTEIQKVLSSLK